MPFDYSKEREENSYAGEERIFKLLADYYGKEWTVVWRGDRSKNNTTNPDGYETNWFFRQSPYDYIAFPHKVKNYDEITKSNADEVYRELKKHKKGAHIIELKERNYNIPELVKRKGDLYIPVSKATALLDKSLVYPDSKIFYINISDASKYDKGIYVVQIDNFIKKMVKQDHKNKDGTITKNYLIPSSDWTNIVGSRARLDKFFSGPFRPIHRGFDKIPTKEFEDMKQSRLTSFIEHTKPEEIEMIETPTETTLAFEDIEKKPKRRILKKHTTIAKTEEELKREKELEHKEAVKKMKERIFFMNEHPELFEME